MKLNKKGFTLIELLAVIVILGILMAVAIPAVTKYVENSKVDTFVNTAKQYCKSLEKALVINSVYCNGSVVTPNTAALVYFSTNSSDGIYYENYKALMDNGGKSPWSEKDIKGYVYFYIYPNEDILTQIYMTDGNHGTASLLPPENLSRSSITNNISYPSMSSVCQIK